MSTLVATAKFNVLALVTKERQHIRVWVHELIPVADGHRHAAEWVEEHLDMVMDYECWKSLAIHDLDEFQLLLTGTIEGHKDYWGEYDEHVDFDTDSIQVAPLPKYYAEQDGGP